MDYSLAAALLLKGRASPRHGVETGRDARGLKMWQLWRSIRANVGTTQSWRLPIADDFRLTLDRGSMNSEDAVRQMFLEGQLKWPLVSLRFDVFFAHCARVLAPSELGGPPREAADLYLCCGCAE